MSEVIQSKCTIGLPISVQAHIYAKNNLGWRDDHIKVVYLDLKSVFEQYGIRHNENSTFTCSDRQPLCGFLSNSCQWGSIATIYVLKCNYNDYKDL